MFQDRKQATRARRILLGVVAYGMWMAVGVYLYALGFLRMSLGALLIYFLLMLANNALFLLAVARNWNLRFKDPGMTFAQIACGILWGMVLLSQAAPQAQGGMLLVFVTGFFFGVFRLSTRQFLALMLLAAACYGAVIAWEWGQLSAQMQRIEMSQWAFLSLVLLWMSFMGGYVARLRSNLRGAMHKIELLASRDHLTGAHNRRAITDTLEHALLHAQSSGSSLSVCMLDIDHFKHVNDTHGHLVGDDVLREFVARVETSLRAGDLLQSAPDDPTATEPVGRFGGEEFLLVLPGTDAEGALRAAERIRSMVAQAPFQTEVGPVRITVSIGIAEYRAGDTPDSLLSRCDRALYQSKTDGRNRVSLG